MAGYAAVGGWLIVAALAANEPAPVDPPAAPSVELLLFLAEFGDAEGRYVDPTTVGAKHDDPALTDEIDPAADEEATDAAPPDRPH